MLHNEQVDLVNVTAESVPQNIENNNYALKADGAQFNIEPSELLDFTLNGASGNRRRSSRTNQDEFEASIKASGIIQPLLVRPIPSDPTKLELLAGYGRRDTAIKIGLATVPVLLRHANDEEAMKMHIDENDKRSSLSLVDEVMQAKEYVTLFKGDKTAAASRIGWGVKKLHERLALGNCTDSVLDALDGGRIKPAHALILSNFESHVQDNTLQKCIDGSMSIEELKQRAGAVQKNLKDAKFDTSECNGCKHNTGDQVGLFDLANNTDKCSNFKCFREKTIEHVSAIASKKFGQIILLSESQEDIVNTTSAEQVGESQFNDGCAICDKNVAIVSDHISTIGMVKANQCTDKECFEKCQAALVAEDSVCEAESETIQTTLDEDAPIAVDVEQSESSREQASEPVKKEKLKTKSKDTTVTMPTKVIEHHKRVLRSISAEHLKDSVQLQKAIQLASLIQTSGISDSDSAIATQYNIEFNYRFETMVHDFRKLDVNVLDELLSEASIYAMTSTGDGNVNFTNIMIKELANEPDGKSIATSQWKADKGNLNIYTKQVLSIIGEQSGFADFLDNQGSEKSITFSQLENKSKSDFIKGLTTSGFDWSDYAPSYFLNHLK